MGPAEWIKSRAMAWIDKRLEPSFRAKLRALPTRQNEYGYDPFGFNRDDAKVAALIARWQAVLPEGELDGLNDGDWLCQCQDWDGDAFQARIDAIEMVGTGVAEVAITVDLGFGEPGSERAERLTLRREGEAWLIDDIVAESFPEGLKQALRETIAADEALAAGNAG